MTWDELKIFIKNKVFLIGITFVDDEETLIEKYQTSGTVIELTDDGVIKFLRGDKSVFQLPYDKESISEAKPGEYREKVTGEIIINPDYITTWTYKIKDVSHMNEVKSKGYLKK